MGTSEPLTTYLELRESTPEGDEGEGLSHKSSGLVLFHVLELAALGEPRGCITLVHDAGDHGARYVDAARSLAEGNWAVALPDMRGHGRSEGPRGHSAGLPEVLRDLSAVQDHVAYRLPDAPKVMMGVGLGALYALAYAVERADQIAALVLLSPLWEPAFELPEPPSGLMKMFKKFGPESPGRVGFAPEKRTGQADEQKALAEDELVHDVITVRAGHQAREIAQTYRARISELTIPTLVLHGGADELADPAASRTVANDTTTVRVLEGMAHDLLHEKGASDIVRDIRRWLPQ